jgi:uncharacterized protein
VNVLKTFWLAGAVTLAIWSAVAVLTGWTQFAAVVVLTVLEITFSFDNAVVNSKLLQTLSPFWQKLFQTVGILVAVFAVRFALPVGIVAVTAHLGFTDVVSLALHHPTIYGLELAKAGPMIDAFGGTFLLMIAFGFFLDAEKSTHWFGWLERRLAPLGKYDNVGIFVMTLVALAVGATVREHLAVLAAAVCGIALHVGLDVFGSVMDGGEGGGHVTKTPAVGLVGVAAAVMFLRLEILDASFSFDGVIGAFAIASSVLIIMAGLGAGAMWVRSMTVYLVKAGTLAQYRFLEHGAHWAIAILGGVMLAKLFGIEPPEWGTGSIGLVLIAAAVIGSVLADRREARQVVEEALAPAA